MRLNLCIAQSGIASRRHADELIKEGKVTVNTKLVREPFHAVTMTDCIEVNGTVIKPQKFAYLIMNKPKGITCTCQDVFAEKIITDCIPEHLRTSGLHPIGRLDKESSGLIILTNDGQLTYRLTHPKFEIEKEYRVRVSGHMEHRHVRKAQIGIQDEGELLTLKSAEILEKGAHSTVLRVILGEGKKRHIRRLFAALGFKVVELIRIRIAGMLLGSLAQGSWQQVSKQKLLSLLFTRAYTPRTSGEKRREQFMRAAKRQATPRKPKRAPSAPHAFKSFLSKHTSRHD